jgi:hypothetical protein
MPLEGETITYVCNITLTSFGRECPTKEEAERLITDQMDGELDDGASLLCIGVEVKDTVQ